MTGVSYFEGKDVGYKRSHEIMMDLLLPHFKTREEVLNHIKKQLSKDVRLCVGGLDHILEYSGLFLSEHNLSRYNIRQQLNGSNTPLTYEVFEHLVGRLGILHERFFPYDETISESKYEELFKKLCKGNWDPVDSVRTLLELRFFHEPE
ncbi:hypothetical protein HYW74_02520 [Candidatus Pacearchaeota archaeon]|nr:hypothetical protein [Candidatus Pacearchaeota archaeon]